MRWFQFTDRKEAGQLLSNELAPYTRRDDVVVLAIPRGGVVVGYEVAKGLVAPLDVVVVRKLVVPAREELTMGAIASGGVRVLNQQVLEAYDIDSGLVDLVTAQELRELVRAEHRYRGERPLFDLSGRVAVLVDDGVASSTAMRAAIRAARTRKPASIVVAAPAVSQLACDELKREVDELAWVVAPEPFYAVGTLYEKFPEVSDEEVVEILGRLGAIPAEEARAR
jgi:predicted phosphoribosyltransferase